MKFRKILHELDNGKIVFIEQETVESFLNRGGEIETVGVIYDSLDVTERDLRGF